MTATAAPLSAVANALSAMLQSGRITGSRVEFASNLLHHYRKAAHRNQMPSEKVQDWIRRLVDEVNHPQARPTAQVGDVAGIFTLFRNAKDRGLKFPKIHLVAADGTPVALSLAGERSKYQGQVQITDGGPFGSNRYFGRVDAQGILTEGREMTPAVRALLEALATDAAGVAAQYGKTTGNCCFCRKALTTAESTSVGYGPVCADKFGLPWGEVIVAPAPVAPEAAAALAPVVETPARPVTDLQGPLPEPVMIEAAQNSLELLETYKPENWETTIQTVRSQFLLTA